jgi:hypothetical protein
MRSITVLRRLTVTGLAGLAFAAFAVAVPTGTMAASPVGSQSLQGVQGSCFVGLLAPVNQNTWVRKDPGFTQMLYTIVPPGVFRITGGPGFANGLKWWQGHGNGAATGWVPEQNLNC